VEVPKDGKRLALSIEAELKETMKEGMQEWI